MDEKTLEASEPAAGRFDETTGEVFDSDAPDNGGWDKERHCITDLRGADWAGRKLREAQEQIRLTWEMHEAEIASLRARIKTAEDRAYLAAAPFKSTVADMTNALTVYASTPDGKAEVLKGLRKKSRLLPCGVTIGWRTQKAGYRWDQRPGPDCGKPPTPAQNRERLLAWAQEETEGPAGAQGLIEERPEVVLEAVKKYAASIHIRGIDNVFTPPGLEYIPASETLTVSVGEEESK